MTNVPDEFYPYGCKLCSLDDNIYMIGNERRVVEYNPRSKTFKYLPRLQEGCKGGHSVCAVDNKIFVVDCDKHPSCEMIDLNDENPQWKYFADTKTSDHEGGELVVVEKKIYVFGGEHSDTVEVYDSDKGKHFIYVHTI